MKNKNFINLTADIKQNIIKNTNKKSKYNNKLFMKRCSVCNHKPKQNEIPLETHHILPQKNASANGYILQKSHLHKKIIYLI